MKFVDKSSAGGCSKVLERASHHRRGNEGKVSLQSQSTVLYVGLVNLAYILRVHKKQGNMYFLIAVYNLKTSYR